MGRPYKLRQVEYPPIFPIFKPARIPMSELEEVTLTLDEYEAIRLADYECLTHEEGAVKMEVSRPTFTRIIEIARKKFSSALIEGKALRIEGGEYRIRKNLSKCRQCGHYWENEECKLVCPKCGGEDVACLGQLYGKPCPKEDCREKGDL